MVSLTAIGNDRVVNRRDYARLLSEGFRVSYSFTKFHRRSKDFRAALIALSHRSMASGQKYSIETRNGENLSTMHGAFQRVSGQQRELREQEENQNHS